MKIISGVLMLVALAGFSGQVHAMGAKGLWLNQSGKARIQVAPCGDDILCGKIVWLREPTDKNGKPLIDHNNGDDRLRKRPVIGVPVAYNMKQIYANKWSGRVYDPERGGQTYVGSMTLMKDGRMKVEGCLLFICESDYWQPISKSQ